MRRLLSIIVFCVVASAIGFATLACTTPSTQVPATPKPPATPLPPNTPVPVPTRAAAAVQHGTIISHSHYYTANSLSGSGTALDKLIANSTVVVIGTVPVSAPDTLRPLDATGNVRVVGSGYNVQVERYLKGSGPDTIPVIQFYGLDFTDQGSNRQARNDDKDLLLGKNNRYLLFLKKNSTAVGYWSGPAHPYKFLLADGKAKVESPVGDLGGAFPERAMTEFISEVEALIASSN